VGEPQVSSMESEVALQAASVWRFCNCIYSRWLLRAFEILFTRDQSTINLPLTIPTMCPEKKRPTCFFR